MSCIQSEATLRPDFVKYADNTYTTGRSWFMMADGDFFIFWGGIWSMWTISTEDEWTHPSHLTLPLYFTVLVQFFFFFSNYYEQLVSQAAAFCPGYRLSGHIYNYIWGALPLWWRLLGLLGRLCVSLIKKNVIYIIFVLKVDWFPHLKIHSNWTSKVKQ